MGLGLRQLIIKRIYYLRSRLEKLEDTEGNRDIRNAALMRIDELEGILKEAG